MRLDGRCSVSCLFVSLSFYVDSIFVGGLLLLLLVVAVCFWDRGSGEGELNEWKRRGLDRSFGLSIFFNYRGRSAGDFPFVAFVWMHSVRYECSRVAFAVEKNKAKRSE